MTTYDLTTQSGRADARAAGNWVGTDSSGNVVSEPGYPGGQAGSSGGDAASGGAGAGGAVGGGGTGVNTAMAQAILQNLQAKANQEYLNAKLNLDTDQEAYQKAAQSIANDLSIAGVTGTYNGMPTQAAIKQLADIAQQQATTMTSYATTFGTWGMPQQGQQTLAAQQQAYNQAKDTATLTGVYQAPTYSPVAPITAPAGQTGPVSTTWDQLSGLLRAASPSTYNDAAAKQQFFAAQGNTQGNRPASLSQQQLDQITAAGTGGAVGSYGQLTGQPGATGSGLSTTWDQVSNQLRQAAGANYNDAAAKQQFFAAQGNTQGNRPTTLSQDQLNAITSAGTGGQMNYAQVNPAAFPQYQPPGQPTGQPVPQYGTGPQQTLAAQAQYATEYGNAGQVPGTDQTTLAAQQQAFNQQLDAQKQALAQWQAQQTAAQNYLTMMSNLRGPADYAQYQKVLGATPGGMQDLVRAAAGQYVPGGGATTGVAPTPVSLNSFVQSSTSGAAGAQPTDTSGQAAMNSLVAPNQMAPQTWNALTPSQQQMLLGTWESQGYTRDDAQALFNQSLPKYATSAPSSGTFKLQ